MAYVIKHSNRKALRYAGERYVTLEELEELIRAGKEISVVDVSTGEDLTSVTLAQIILENERNSPRHAAHCLPPPAHQAWRGVAGPVQRSLKSTSTAS